MLPVAILAGGLATRLRPLTAAIPKSLVDVAGRPFVVRQLAYLQRQGITRVVLCVGFLGEQIEAAVGDGAAFGLKVDYAWDGPRPRGTGGALRQALPLLGGRFFVLYGDSFLPIDFRAVERDFVTCGRPALMTVLKNDNRWDASNVLFRDGCIVRYDKRQPCPDMAHIDYGLGVLSEAALLGMPGSEPFDLADLYGRLSAQGALAGHEVFERFYEIGSPAGLAATIDYFRKKDGP